MTAKTIEISILTFTIRRYQMTGIKIKEETLLSLRNSLQDNVSHMILETLKKISNFSTTGMGSLWFV